MDDKAPTVYVVVLSWNGKADTLECLDSLLRVDYPDYRVVLVDNGSTDNTVPVVRRQFPSVQIIENGQNLGYAEGNNVGVKYALAEGADYVLILNNDTVIDDQALSFMVNNAERRPESGILSPKILLYSSPETIWFAGTNWVPERAIFVPPHSGEKDKPEEVQAFSQTDYASGCALFFRSQVARDIGLFDPRFFLMWEEADWCFRARRRGYEIRVEPKAKVWHKVSSSFGDGCTGPKCQYYYSRNRWLWIQKNLDGRERRQAFIRCLREMYWTMLELRSSRSGSSERLVLQARLEGSLHFFLRRFGPNLTFERV